MKIKSLLLSAMACLIFSPAQADISILLKSDFISGTSKVEGYEGLVQLNSLDWEVLSELLRVGPLGDANEDLMYCGVNTTMKIHKNLDSSSPDFINMLFFGGGSLAADYGNPKFTILMVRTDVEPEPRVLVKIILDYPRVMSYRTVAETGEGRPVESIGLGFEAIRGRVMNYDSSGNRDGFSEFNLNCRPE